MFHFSIWIYSISSNTRSYHDFQVCFHTISLHALLLYRIWQKKPVGSRIPRSFGKRGMKKQKELSSTLTSFQHKFNLKLVVYLLFGFIFGVVIERSSQKINKTTSKLKTNRDSEKPSIQTPSSQVKNGTGCFAEITEYHLTLFCSMNVVFLPKIWNFKKSPSTKSTLLSTSIILPAMYIITPTYKRLLQKAELTRVGEALVASRVPIHCTLHPEG